MKILKIAIPILLFVIAALAMYHQASEAVPPLASVMPEGALYYVEARDFGALLHDWNSSEEKKTWLKSDALSVFSRSRLYLRLKDAQDQFGEVAGLNPNMNLLGDSAGDETAFAWYDIGALEFLYVSHTSSAKAMQNALWQSKARFETRQAGNTPFYVKKNPKTHREVAFAIVGDLLVIGTREDLVAASIGLIQGNKEHALIHEGWYAKATAAAAERGDLRMVLNLKELVPSPYFRTYWVQQNISDMKQYSAAVSDLFRTPQAYREERVMLRDEENENTWTSVTEDQSKTVSQLAKLVPENTGFYRASAAPTADSVADALIVKVLSPHLGAAPVEKMSPQVSLGSGETGSESDLETRIDQPPTARTSTETSTAKLAAMLNANAARAMLVVHSSELTPDGAFVNLRSAVAVRGTSDWKREEVRDALAAVVRPGMTVFSLGTAWQAQPENRAVERFDGLSSITFAVSGSLLVVGNDPADVSAMLKKASVASAGEPVAYVAGFQHQRERGNYLKLVKTVDKTSDITENGAARGEHEPQFFSENIASISTMYRSLQSEQIAVKDEGAKVRQTVKYEWSR